MQRKTVSVTVEGHGVTAWLGKLPIPPRVYEVPGLVASSLDLFGKSSAEFHVLGFGAERPSTDSAAELVTWAMKRMAVQVPAWAEIVKGANLRVEVEQG